MSRNPLSAIVSRQLPEFVREDYPAFVAFVEAYYAWLKTQQVDLESSRDLDNTLNVFVSQFKKELSYNLPFIVEDERFFLQRMKDHYLAKGSEASYKLLFKMLYGKDVLVKYPGKQMLRASAGHWNQEISIFVKVNFGNPEVVVGKVVDVQTFNKIIRVLIDKKQELSTEVDRIVYLGQDVYEFFLDRRFYGIISPGNIITYGDQFQATVLSAASKLNIVRAGTGFKVGQVFEVKSSSGTTSLIKVTRVDPANGALKNAQIIKFGIGYIANFTTSVLPAAAITNSTTFKQPDSSIVVGARVQTGGDVNNPIFTQPMTLKEVGARFGEKGFINTPDWAEFEYVDGAYAGTIIREFAQTTLEASSSFAVGVAAEPAVFNIELGAICKYPGYFENNNGFLSDSIYLQDSKYYQLFSYVITIDERLADYKSAVKTLIHPAGMQLFGEFDITNTYDLSLQLESLVKSLGISLEEDPVVIQDVFSKTFVKYPLGDEVTMTEPTVNNHQTTDPVTGLNSSKIRHTTTKPLQTTYSGFLDSITQINTTLSKSDYVMMLESPLEVVQGKTMVPDSVTVFESNFFVVQDKFYSDLQQISEPLFLVVQNNNKYMEVLPLSLTLSEDGYVVLNAYEEGGYFSEIYVNNRDATFSG
jgi:hypothetical protein